MLNIVGWDGDLVLHGIDLYLKPDDPNSVSLALSILSLVASLIFHTAISLCRQS
jgi:hypothetical protein